MTNPSLFAIGPFHLDLANETLSRGPDRLALKPKSFAVLRYLAERPQQLVTKRELLETHWPDVAVGEAVLKTCIAEIRKALGDQPTHPQFIETVHRRGYRFLVSVTPIADKHDSDAIRSPEKEMPFVGREADLAQLKAWYEKARQGQRQLVFVTGEAGIGKTRLVDVFVEILAVRGDVWIGRGQCVEHYGAGEAYLPILEALGRLCRHPGGDRLVTLLKRMAPTWLGQLTGVVEPAELQAILPSIAGATPVRVMRELADAIGAFANEFPLVLIMEDLRWLDHSTLAWLAYMARRSGPARLMIIGTYRPTDLILQDHPLKGVKHELLMHGHCRELPLECLSKTEVRDYLALRLVADPPPPDHALNALAQVIYSRTEGNPLFMVNILDYLLIRQLLVHEDATLRLADAPALQAIPTGLREFIDLRIEQLAEADRNVLAAASVAGLDFSTATVAAALETSAEEVDGHCHELARSRQFIAAAGVSEWPDGTRSVQYQFLHALYRETLYGRLPLTLRAAMHRRVAERLEQGYGERSREIAAELALHFERGQEANKAIHYHHQAGEDALKRSACQEAITHLTAALDLLRTLPSGLARDARELRLQSTLGIPLVLTKSFSAPEVAAAFGRARELCRHFPDDPQLFPVIFGLFGFYITRGDMKSALEMSEELLRLAKQAHDETLSLIAHLNRAGYLLHLGELRTARGHLDRVRSAYHRDTHRSLFYQYGMDAGNAGITFYSWWSWLSGYPDQARRQGEDAIADARKLGHNYTVCGALACNAIGHVLEQDAVAVLTMTEEALPLATDKGFPLWIGIGLVVRGWAKSAQGNHDEGFKDLEEGHSLIDRIGQKVFLNLAMTCCGDMTLRAKRHQEGLNIVANALDFTAGSGIRWFEAEMLRLKGELLLGGNGREKNSIEREAEGCFLQAIEVAQAQEAKWFELRATMSLSRLWQQQRKGERAQRKLKAIVAWFTEGLMTKDLQEANRLLKSLK